MDAKELPHIPFITVRETSAQDVASIIRAADSSKRSLSAVEYTESTPSFKMLPEHIGVAAAVLMIGAIIVIYAFTSMMRYAIGGALVLGMLFALYLFFVSVYQLNATRRYYVAYETAAAESSRIIKLEVHQDKNRINYVTLPEWLTEAAIMMLAAHARGRRGFVFNREHCSQAGICSYRQWPELRDSFVKASLAQQSGKQYSLTDSFFTFAESLNQA